MNESVISNLDAKQRLMGAKLSSQMQAAVKTSLLSQAAAQAASGSKEAVLRKLLETQDSYIHELEAKCKAMSAQLLSDQNGQWSMNASKANQNMDGLDLVQLEISQETTGEKLSQVVQVLSQAFSKSHTTEQSNSNRNKQDLEYTHPIVGNAIQAIQIIRNGVNLEDQVHQQRAMQYASLINAMQARFQKERDEHKALFEKNEQANIQKILSLEQEIIVHKQHVRTFSQDQKNNEKKEQLTAGVLAEMENLESRYRQGEEELQQQNKQLRRQLQEAQINGREATYQLTALKQSVNLTETEEFACIKRIEGQIRVIFKEFKSAQAKIFYVGSQSDPEQDQRIEKALSQLNRQIQALDDELEQEFSSIVSLQSTQHRQEIIGSPNEKQLQILLRDAEREIQNLREQLQITESQEQERTQSVWVTKLEIVNNEKKALQAELKKLVEISSMREEMLTQDNVTLSQDFSRLRQTSIETEQMLQNEITAIKRQLASVMQQLQQTGNSVSHSVLLGTPETQQVANEIVARAQTANQSLIAGKENEVRLLRNLNENLQRQLKETNQMLGRPNSFEKQNGVGLIYNKLEVRQVDLIRSVQASLISLAEMVSKQLNQPQPSIKETRQKQSEQEKTILAYERQLFESREQTEQLRLELDQAKLCLVQQFTAAQEQAPQQMASEIDPVDGKMVNILVSKFSIEIERLKAQNSQLKLQRDNVTHFYKEEFTRLWQKYTDLQNGGSAILIDKGNKKKLIQCTEVQEIIDKIGDQLSEFKNFVQTLRAEEIKQLQDKVSSFHLKHTPKPETSRKGTNHMTAVETLDTQMARNESNFSFNYSAQRSMLYEEIEILREQVGQFSDSYQRATQSRDEQFQLLVKERNILQQREALLDATLEDAIQIIQVSEQHHQERADWKRENEIQESQQLKEANMALGRKLQAEKDIHEIELDQVQTSYQEKFVQLKEREALLELQLAQLDKDLKASRDSLWQMREQKDETIQNLNAEIGNLKKFANQRQVELLEARRQVTLFYKRTKESIVTREAELKRIFRDQIGSHIKVLEIELKKLQKCSQKYEQ